jgi:hypothetical protein
MNNVPDKDKTPKVGKLINFTVVHFSSNIGVYEYRLFRFIFIRTKKISKHKCLSIADKFEIFNKVDKGVKKKDIAAKLVFQQVLYQPF